MVKRMAVNQELVNQHVQCTVLNCNQCIVACSWRQCKWHIAVSQTLQDRGTPCEQFKKGQGLPPGFVSEQVSFLESVCNGEAAWADNVPVAICFNQSFM